MESLIREIGNSKGIIIPKSILKKYHFHNKVVFVETDQGLMIKPCDKSDFDLKIAELKANKSKIYAEMSEQAQDSSVINYYEQQTDELDNIDIEIL